MHSVWLQLVLFFSVLLLTVKPLGHYIANVLKGERVFLSPVMLPLERFIYRLAGIDETSEMSWTTYTLALLLFSFVNFVVVYGLLILQPYLPLNPENMPSISGHLAFNIASSFITNTNWQSYAGESTLSLFSQVFIIMVQQFISPAVGLAVFAAFTRAFIRKNADTIGNFFVDMLRSILYILLPLAFLFALLFASQGVVQSFTSRQEVPWLEAGDTGSQTVQHLATGPVAMMEAIKQIGSNGGGFYNANSAHPFANPTPLSNFLSMLAIILIPAALCLSFGVIIGSRRQGYSLLAAMFIVFLPIMAGCIMAEQSGNQAFAGLSVDQSMTALQGGGNMEGKELRFGAMNSALWATLTTATSSGSVNAMHESFTPLGGLYPLLLIDFGEVIFGGVGSGLYGMLIFVILSVFIAGLMVGRTPEFLGKKIQVFEIKMASLFILIPASMILLGTGLALMIPQGTSSILNPGATGLSEVLYAFSSAANNNGSAFAGLASNTVFYNVVLGVAMLIGRFFLIISVLAIAGSIARKNTVPQSVGTLPTDTPLFVGILIGIILIIGVLTFVPALALGPIAEHLLQF